MFINVMHLFIIKSSVMCDTKSYYVLTLKSLFREFFQPPLMLCSSELTEAELGDMSSCSGVGLVSLGSGVMSRDAAMAPGEGGAL
jgi:hypothetical protein